MSAKPRFYTILAIILVLTVTLPTLLAPPLYGSEEKPVGDGIKVLGKTMFEWYTSFDEKPDRIIWSKEPVLLHSKAVLRGSGSFIVSLNDSPKSFFSAWLVKIKYKGDLTSITLKGQSGDDVLFKPDEMTVAAITPSIPEPYPGLEEYNITGSELTTCDNDSNTTHVLELLYHTPTGSIVVACDGFYAGMAVTHLSIQLNELHVSWTGEAEFYSITVNAYDLASSRDRLDLPPAFTNTTVFPVLVYAGEDGFVLYLREWGGLNENLLFYSLSDGNKPSLAFVSDFKYDMVFAKIRKGYYIAGPKAAHFIAMVNGELVATHLPGHDPEDALAAAGLEVLNTSTPWRCQGYNISPSGTMAYLLSSPPVYKFFEPFSRVYLVESLSIANRSGVDTPLLIGVYLPVTELLNPMAFLQRHSPSLCPGVCGCQRIVWLTNDTLAFLEPLSGKLLVYNTSSRTLFKTNLNGIRNIILTDNDTLVLADMNRSIYRVNTDSIPGLDPIVFVPSDGLVFLVEMGFNEPSATEMYVIAFEESYAGTGNESIIYGDAWPLREPERIILDSLTDTGNMYYYLWNVMPSNGSTMYKGIAMPSAIFYTSVSDGEKCSLDRLGGRLGEYLLPLRVWIDGYTSIDSGDLLLSAFTFFPLDMIVRPPNLWPEKKLNMLLLLDSQANTCTMKTLSISSMDSWNLIVLDGKVYALALSNNSKNVYIETGSPAALFFTTNMTISKGHFSVDTNIQGPNLSCFIYDFAPECHGKSVDLDPGEHTFTATVSTGSTGSVSYVFRILIPGSPIMNAPNTQAGGATGAPTAVPGADNRLLLLAVVVGSVVTFVFYMYYKKRVKMNTIGEKT